jgi:hypothetical protein
MVYLLKMVDFSMAIAVSHFTRWYNPSVPWSIFETYKVGYGDRALSIQSIPTLG